MSGEGDDCAHHVLECCCHEPPREPWLLVRPTKEQLAYLDGIKDTWMERFYLRYECALRELEYAWHDRWSFEHGRGGPAMRADLRRRVTQVRGHRDRLLKEGLAVPRSAPRAP